MLTDVNKLYFNVSYEMAVRVWCVRGGVAFLSGGRRSPGNLEASSIQGLQTKQGLLVPGPLLVKVLSALEEGTWCIYL